MGALLNSLFQVIYTIGYFLLTLVWELVRICLNIAVLLENVNQWIIDNVGILVELVTNALAAPLGAMFIIAIAALGAWYLFNTVIATRKWVEPSQLLIYGFITLFFFAGPTLIIDQLEELRGAVQLNLATAMTTIDNETAGQIVAITATGTDTGLPATIPDVMDMGAYLNVVDPFDMASAYLLLATLDELDNVEFPQAFEAAYAPDDPTNASFNGFQAFTTSLSAMMQGFTVLVTALIFILPTVVADHLLRLILTLVAVILYLGAPLAMVLAYFVYTNSFLAAYIRQYINLLIETFLTYLIISVVIYAMQAAALASIGLFLAVGLVGLIIYIWRIASALKLASKGIDLFGGGMLTGGASGMDLVRTGASTAGMATAAVGGAALVAAAGGMRQVDKMRGDRRDPAALERDRRLKVLAGYAIGSSRPLGQAVDKLSRTQGLVRTVVVAPENQKPNALDYVTVGNVAALNNSPFYRMGLDRGFGQAFSELGGRQRYFGGTTDPDEMGQAFQGRYQGERGGRAQAAYPDQGVESAYQRYRQQQGTFETRFRYEQDNPDVAVPPFSRAGEATYKQWRKERSQFQERFEKEQDRGKPGRRYAGAKKELRYARFAAGQEAEGAREAQMLSRYAWAKENGDAAGAASYASNFDETLYQQMRARLDKFDERFGWERHNPEETFPPYMDVGEERAYQRYADGRLDAAAGGPPPTDPEDHNSGGPGHPDGPGGGPNGSPNSNGPTGVSDEANTDWAEEAPEFGHNGRSRQPIAPPANLDESTETSSKSQEPAGLTERPASSMDYWESANHEVGSNGKPSGHHDSAREHGALRLVTDENGLPVRVTQIDTNQDGQADNWQAAAAAGHSQPPPQLSLAEYQPDKADHLTPTFTHLAVSPNNVPTNEASNNFAQQTLQHAARDKAVGPAGLSQAAQAINDLYGQMNGNLMPAGEILDQFRSEEVAEQIRTRTGLPLSSATIGHLADQVLQPQQTIAPAELAAAAATAAAHGHIGERGVAAQLGMGHNFGAMTGVVRELTDAIATLNLGQNEAATLTTRVQAGQGAAVAAQLVAEGQSPQATTRFVNTAQILRPQIVTPTTLYEPGDLDGFERVTGKENA